MRNRNPFIVFLLSWFTCGIYSIIWLIQTKKEMNEMGACIPSAWLMLVPFANIYWLWRYSEGAEEITEGRAATLTTFVLLVVLGPIGMAISQSYYNNARNLLEEGEGDIRITIESLGT